MKYGYWFRIKKLFIPSVIAVCCAVVVYHVITWCFILCFGFDAVDEWIRRIFLMAVVISVAIFVGLKNPLKVILDEGTCNRVRYGAILAAVMVLMLITSDFYLDHRWAKFQPIKTVKQQAAYPHEKYYEIDSFEVDKVFLRRSVQTRTKSSGRGYHSSKRYFYEIYVMAPFKGQNRYWYTLHFTREVPRLNESYQYIALREVAKKLKNDNFQSTHRFKRVLGFLDKSIYTDMIRSDKSISLTSKQLIFLTPVSAQDENRYRNNLNAMGGIFAVGMSMLLIILGFAWTDLEYIKKYNASCRKEQENINIRQL